MRWWQHVYCILLLFKKNVVCPRQALIFPLHPLCTFLPVVSIYTRYIPLVRFFALQTKSNSSVTMQFKSIVAVSAVAATAFAQQIADPYVILLHGSANLRLSD